MAKNVTEVIIEAENDDKVLDKIYKPYSILHDNNVDCLNQAINILAVKRGYRVISVSQSGEVWTACLEKKDNSK